MLSDRDTSPTAHFDTECTQFAEGSQQLLRAKRVTDHQRRRQARCQRT